MNSLKGQKGDAGANGKDGINGQDGANGKDGADGKSAYQIWLDEGNTGTVEDYLASLKGEAGKNGINGANGQNGQDGVDGKSAYQIWLEQGNVGTEEDFLNSLKGDSNLYYQNAEKTENSVVFAVDKTVTINNTDYVTDALGVTGESNSFKLKTKKGMAYNLNLRHVAGEAITNISGGQLLIASLKTATKELKSKRLSSIEDLETITFIADNTETLEAILSITVQTGAKCTNLEYAISLEESNMIPMRYTEIYNMVWGE